MIEMIAPGLQQEIIAEGRRVIDLVIVKVPGWCYFAWTIGRLRA